MKGVSIYTEESETYFSPETRVQNLRPPMFPTFPNTFVTRERNLCNIQLPCPSELMENDNGIGESGAGNYDEFDFICAQLRRTRIGNTSVIDSRITTLDTRNSHLTACCSAEDISIDGPTQTFPTDVEKIYNQDIDGDTFLHIAIIVGKKDEALGFINIATDPDLISIQNFICQSPLHLAVLTRQHEIVRRLVVGGANLESRDQAGNTPLHLACRDGSVELIDALIEPVSIEEKQQNKYVTMIGDINHYMEIPNYDGLPCIHVASELGHFDLVRYLIFKGADINSIDRKSGRTLLHKAAIDGNEHLAKMLLSFNSCNINAKAFDDNTPFDFARDRDYHALTFELAAEATRRAKADTSN